MDGVVVVDSDGAEVFRNAAAERFRHARHADAVAARAITELLDGRVAADASSASCSSSARPGRCTLQALPLSDDDAARWARSFVYDVSEIHRVDSVRRDFVANVSHELKTPIGALEVLAETLLVGDRPGRRRPLAESLVKEADRLGKIVDDLLDLSLIETQGADDAEPLPVSVLLEEAVDRMRPAGRGRGDRARRYDGTRTVRAWPATGASW